MSDPPRRRRDDPPAEIPAAVGRRRLRRAMRPALTRGQILAAVLCAVLGFALVAQVRQTQRSTIGTLRQGDLIGLLQNVTTQSARLDAQARELQGQLSELRTGSDRAAVAEEVAREQLDRYQILAGTTAADGPGIELDISDPHRAVSAAMLLDCVQELRGAGAEAIQIGDVRVVVDTAFVDDPGGGGVVVDSHLLAPPYHLVAIGGASSLHRALAIPGGILESLHARQAAGTVTERTSTRVSATHRPAPATYARPVGATPTP